MLMIPEATPDEIQRIAVRTLNEPTNPGDYWHGRLPDPEHFKALQQPVRQYLTIRKRAPILLRRCRNRVYEGDG